MEYQPLGVVGAIGPWNYPAGAICVLAAYALAAGNAMVYKPSEYTPGVSQWLADRFAEVVPEQPVLQVVHGLGDTGAALCRSRVDKVAFIGSTATAKKVMATCAETLTPLLAECGGKDAMIVDADGDLDAAADAALWGGLCNAGQTCTGIERVHVASAVADEFIHRLVSEAQKLKVGVDDDATLGPIIMPAQVDTIRRHIADGVADGGTAALGGAEAVQPPYVQPTILVDVPEDSTAVREETFGPVLVVNRVRDAEEGIARANALPYALGGSVFARRRGLELARRRARPGRDRTACRDRHAPAPRPLLAGPTAKHGGAFPTLAMERRPRGRRENRRGTTGPHRSPAGVQRMLSSPGR
jgi:succinate-semialdehyde dehydrogenase / glutarate-semialdehyde dehydrogenase